MTIRDLINNGIEIQGCVDIQYCDDKRDCNVLIFRDDSKDATVIFNDDVLDYEIKYIYSVARHDLVTDEVYSVTVIEIEKGE